ncbi:hypothetical protein RJ639_021329 [Escallonia herrerae]|uniref:DUF7788 domain-containing protein n=1 Tax=Escallonia herrerae TaxID=1293975 RepID=A0AA88V4G6_9ASTE|nr:hypothetical protein RJ639_021329 [Escallonia herrerae]
MDSVLTVFVSDPSGPRLMPPPSPPSRPAPSSSRSTSPSPPSSPPSNHSTRGLPPSSNSDSQSLPSSRPTSTRPSPISKDSVCVRSTSDPRRPVQIWLIAVNRVASVQLQGEISEARQGAIRRQSRASAPLEVSVAVGLLISELSEEPWKGKLITFGEKPRLISVEEYKNLVMLD